MATSEQASSVQCPDCGMIDDSDDRNAMDNLVTLCRSCHSKAEHMAPLYPF